MRCPGCNGTLKYIIKDNKRLIYCPIESKEFNMVNGKLVEIIDYRPPVEETNVQYPKRARRSK